jgi:hypothetical protein
LLACGGVAQDDNTVATARQLFVVRYEPGLQPLAINRMHSWVIHVEMADGTPVDNASVMLVGGMPDHDHGLPTVPQTTRYLGAGDYLVEGVKFHMNGRWLITITIDAGDSRDEVTFELRL